MFGAADANVSIVLSLIILFRSLDSLWMGRRRPAC